MDGYTKYVNAEGNITIFMKGDIYMGKFVEYTSGDIKSERWYNAEGLLHREGQPAAIIRTNGEITGEYWYENGKFHRVGGPAKIEYRDGKIVKEWWYENDRKIYMSDEEEEQSAPDTAVILARIKADLAILEARFAKIAAN